MKLEKNLAGCSVFHYGVNMLNIIGMFWILLSWVWGLSTERWYVYGGLYLFFATWAIEVVLEKRWQNFHWDKRKIYYTIVITFFCLPLIYAPWDGSVHFHRLLEYRLGLIGFSLVGILGINKYYNLELMFGCFIGIAFAMVVYLFSLVGWDTLVHDPNRMYLLAETRIAHINAHMQFNFFLNVALVGIWYWLFYTQHKVTIYWRILLSIVALVLIITLLLSEGRSGLLACLMVVGSLTLYQTWQWRKWACVLVMAIVLGSAGYVVSHHQRMSQGAVNSELRIRYWGLATKLIAQKPILGYGMSSAQEEFSKYSADCCTEAEREHWQAYFDVIDAHNQYLQIMLEFGCVGLLFLLSVYLGPVIIDQSHRIVSVYLVGLSMFQSVFDMFVTGGFCILFCVLVLMMLNMNVSHLSNPE